MRGVEPTDARPRTHAHTPTQCRVHKAQTAARASLGLFSSLYVLPKLNEQIVHQFFY